MVCNIFSIVTLDEMKYMHVAIWVEVEMRGINLDRIVILRSTINLFSITQSKKRPRHADDERLWNYQNMAMCSYIYCGTRQYCQIHLCNDCICMFCETWIEFAWFYNSEILVKMPLHFQRHFRVKRDCLLFSVNVKLFFEFFAMREKVNYFCVKLFSEEV